MGLLGREGREGYNVTSHIEAQRPELYLHVHARNDHVTLTLSFCSKASCAAWIELSTRSATAKAMSEKCALKSHST